MNGQFLRTLALFAGISISIPSRGALLNEIEAHPPGTDNPYEYIEITGTPNESLANMWLLVIDGQGDVNPGRLALFVDLGNVVGNLPANGLLIVKASNDQNGQPRGHAINPCNGGTRVVTVDALANGDTIQNSASTILLMQVPVGTQAPTVGTDYDQDNNGGVKTDNATLDAPLNANGIVILDAVGWRRDGNSGANSHDVLYLPAGLNRVSQGSGQPDALARFPGDPTRNNLASWYGGCLKGNNLSQRSLDYSTVNGETTGNFPAGAFLTPGAPNEPNDFTSASPLSQPGPRSGDIFGANPLITVTANNVVGVTVTGISVTTSDQNVVPDANIVVSSLGNDIWALATSPISNGVNVLITLTPLTPDPDLARRRTFRYAASRTASDGSLLFTGGSDASAAIPVGTGNAGIMYVADDETNRIHLYPRTYSSNAPAATASWDFSGQLSLTAGVSQELDLEGATSVGNDFYWIGSHANDGDPPSYAARPNRERLFKTTRNVNNNNLTLMGFYSGLRQAIRNWDPGYGLAASMGDNGPVNPKSAAGFNIEALAAANANLAYIGLRAPLVPAAGPRTHALLIPINNLDAVTSVLPPGVPPNASLGVNAAGRGVEMDLGQRGVRSMELFGTEYLIMAGRPDNGLDANNLLVASNFAVFTWNGAAPANFGQLATVTEYGADLIGVSAEAIVEKISVGAIGTGTQIRIMEDNGTNDFYSLTVNGSGVQAKDLPYAEYKKSKSRILTLGRKASVTYYAGLLTIEDTGIFNMCPTPGGTLGACSGSYGEAFAINNNGLITGTTDPVNSCQNATFTEAYVWKHAPWWAGGPFQALSTSPSSGYGANINDWVVGYSPGPPTFQLQTATRWYPQNGWYTYESIGPSGVVSHARGVNDGGRIVGWYELAANGNQANPPNVGGFYWENAVRTPLPGSGTIPTRAYAINNRKYIVGISTAVGGTVSACIWEPTSTGTYGKPVQLPPLPNGGASEALSINEAGTIVGDAFNSVGQQRACAWKKIGSRYFIFDLGALAGGTSIAWDINNSGQIVGSSKINATTAHACTWINGNIIDLNDRMLQTCLDWGGGVRPETAYSINDSGSITGSAYTPGTPTWKAYILVPSN